MNSNGTQIVGQSHERERDWRLRSFIPTSAGCIQLGTLSHVAATDQSIANGISDNGRVVGWSGNPVR